VTDRRADFVRHPLDYPGTRIERSVLLLPGGERPLDPGPGAFGRLNDELLAHRAVPMELRTPVAAVGSNASPDVVRAKLLAAGLAPAVPLICGLLHDLRVSLSAHVSRPGFIPAAPARVAGDVAEVVVGWFDAEQLARLDATEPNYDRTLLSAQDHRLDLIDWPQPTNSTTSTTSADPTSSTDPTDPTTSTNRAWSDWPALDGVEVYRSKWGVLASSDGPWHLRPQAELSARFAELGIEPWVSRSPMEAARELARSAELRTQARHEFQRLDLVRI
jgi:hypothetical protein